MSGKITPSTKWAALTPGDKTNNVRGIYVSVGGNLVIVGSDDVSATFVTVAGQVLPLAPKSIDASSTGTYIGLY